MEMLAVSIAEEKQRVILRAPGRRNDLAEQRNSACFASSLIAIAPWDDRASRRPNGIRGLTVCVVVFTVLLLAWGTQKAHGDEVAAALANIRPHPRLLMSDQRLAELKELEKTDAVLAKAVKAVLAQAEEELKKPVPTSAGEWGTLGKHRMYLLGFAHRWTGAEKYARKVEQDLLAVTGLQDWKGSFLMTAETSHSVGVGYDWCYKALGEESRKKIRAGLITNGLKPYLDALDKKEWWTRSAFNWNQVCNGGTLLGALGVADEEPEIAVKVLRHAVQSLPLALKTYDEDGLWPESLDYWQYATEYTVWALAGLQTALGTDLGLSDPERFKGLSKAGTAVIYGAGPFGQYVNFADTMENKKRWALPYLFWLGKRYESGHASYHLIQTAANAMSKWPAALDVVWYVHLPIPAQPPEPLPRDKHFRGSVELATFRSVWNDSNALFASLKAGFNEVNHGHMDLGVFELDALGVRWARDLGKDNYGLPGYFSDRGPGGKAWNIYRLRSVSHSVPLIDGKDQPLNARAKIIRFAGEGDQKPIAIPFALVDLGEAYPAATRAQRGLSLVADRRAILVQDEFDLPEPHEVLWAMTTDATIQLDKASATLTLKGKQLKATILSPAGAEFSSESAEQKPPESTNKGVSRLLVRLKDANGPVRVAVLLAPDWPDGKPVDPPEVEPLKDWIGR